MPKTPAGTLYPEFRGIQSEMDWLIGDVRLEYLHAPYNSRKGQQFIDNRREVWNKIIYSMEAKILYTQMLKNDFYANTQKQ